MAAGRGQRRGWKKDTVTGRGQGPTGVLTPFRGCGMQLPSLSPVNEATDGSFWGSGPKVCHEKEGNVNALSRKKQLHGPMSSDMSVKAKQTGVFLREIRARIGRSAKVSEGAEAPCVSQAQVPRRRTPEEPVFEEQASENAAPEYAPAGRPYTTLSQNPPDTSQSRGNLPLAFLPRPGNCRLEWKKGVRRNIHSAERPRGEREGKGSRRRHHLPARLCSLFCPCQPVTESQLLLSPSRWRPPTRRFQDPVPFYGHFPGVLQKSQLSPHFLLFLSPLLRVFMGSQRPHSSSFWGDLACSRAYLFPPSFLL